MVQHIYIILLTLVYINTYNTYNTYNTAITFWSVEIMQAIEGF